MIKPETVDEYIANESQGTQSILNKLRAIAKRLAPIAVESISFGMPTYKIGKKIIIQFYAAKNHIGVYPQAETVEAFASRLTEYKTIKHGISFPHNKPIPYDSIEEMIVSRVEDK